MKKFFIITVAFASLLLINKSLAKNNYLILDVVNNIEALTSPEYLHQMKPKFTIFTAETINATYTQMTHYGDFTEENQVTAELSNIDSPYYFIYYDCVGAIFKYKVCDINRVGWQNPNNYVN